MPDTLPYQTPQPTRQFPVEVLIPLSCLAVIGLFWVTGNYIHIEVRAQDPHWDLGRPFRGPIQGTAWILPWPAVATPFLYWLCSSCHRYLSPQRTPRIDQTH
jgi:hypothetical protein